MTAATLPDILADLAREIVAERERAREGAAYAEREREIREFVEEITTCSEGRS